MNFISGFLGLCSAASPGAATEITAAGYNRQPIQFSMPQNGLSVNMRPWSFGPIAGLTSVAARAIFDAPTDGNLLLVLPHAAPRGVNWAAAADRGDDGDINLVITALADYPDASAYTAGLVAGATLGLVYDSQEVIGWSTTLPNAQAGVTALPIGCQFLQVLASPLTAGVGLVIDRGVLAAAS